MRRKFYRGMALLLVVLFLVPLQGFSVVSSASDEAQVFEGHRYQVFDESMTWTEAKAYCESLGGYLATITSEEENTFITDILKNGERNVYWIGGYKDDNIWHWVTGEEFNYTHWARCQPDNNTASGGEDKLQIYRNSNPVVSGNGLGAWNDLNDSGTCGNQSFFGLKNHGFICEWGSIEIIPDGYDFDEDRWSFENINESIVSEYYTGMYGKQKGSELYKAKEDGSAHGHCFGMATTTAATLWNCPYVTEYLSWMMLPYQNLIDVNKGTINLDLNMTAKDYIKYAHIYQLSSGVSSQRGSASHNGSQNVYSAVLQNANSTNGTGTIIDIFGGVSPYSNEHGGHTIYAIGIDGNDILVNDSNTPGTVQRITVNGNSWEYSAGGWRWSDSVGSSINYVDDVDVLMPYMYLTYAVTDYARSVSPMAATTIFNSTYTYTEEEELNGSTPFYAENIEIVDADKLLVVSNTEAFDFAQDEQMLSIESIEDAADPSKELYWLSDETVLTAENTSNTAAQLKLVDNDLKIEATVPVDSSADIVMNGEESSGIDFDTTVGQELSFAFVELDEEDEFITTTITGTAASETVTAEETDTGLVVTGLNDMTVTLETADGSAETAAQVKDGATVQITVDEENTTVATDWTCSHPDANHDGICDNCSEDFTASCNHFCHSENKFVQFIWKILNFFYRLFGIEDMRICSCGKYHW